MSSLTKQVQQEFERGVILRILVNWQLEWMPFNELRLQVLRRTGYALADRELQFHLNYLSQAGYLEIKCLRAHQANFELSVVRATSRAVDLLEGRTPADAGIAL